MPNGLNISLLLIILSAGHVSTGVSETISKAIHLDCLPSGWLITVDLKTLSVRQENASQLYLTTDSCTGTLQGEQLVFKLNYTDCHSIKTVTNDSITYKNTIFNAPLTPGGVVRNVTWMHDIECSVKRDGSGSVHILKEDILKVTYYKDRTYYQQLSGDVVHAKQGETVYVQVKSEKGDKVMVVDDCDAHIQGNANTVYPLIQDGCRMDTTHMIASRYQIMRFKFEIKNHIQESGIKVTCRATFCDVTDYSDKCQQKCHRVQNGAVIG